MKKINVAITVNFEANSEQNIFFNGTNQHCVYLYILLKRLPIIGSVWLAGNVVGKDISAKMMLDEFKEDIVPLNTIIYNVDLLIEMNSFIGNDHANVIRKNGGKIIAYKMGNEFFMSAESIVFDAHRNWVPHRNSVQFNAVWTNPQHELSCKSFFKHLYNAPVYILPHLWSPYFIEQKRKLDPNFSDAWGYRPRPDLKRRIGIFEPHLNVLKTSIIPIYATNAAYLRDKQTIEHVYVTNTLHLIDHPVFKHLALQCKVCTDHVASIDPRFPFVDFMAHQCDIVLSHQIENGLNFLYFEALYGGYPLVHNSQLLGNCGYKYNDYDIDEACRAILEAAHTHDVNLGVYREKASLLLEMFNPMNPVILSQYQKAIQHLFIPS